MTDGTYSADVPEILQRNRELRAAIDASKKVMEDFTRLCGVYAGWHGTEGKFDSFANELGPKIRDMERVVEDTLEGIVTSFLGITDQVSVEAAAVQRPQDQALGDIQALAGEGGSRR